MWAAARSSLVVAALVSGCTSGQHHATARPAPVGGQDRLVFDGGAVPSTHPGTAVFEITNVDAGPIVVSSSSPRLVRVACPDDVRLRVRVGDGSRELTVRQVAGQLLLRTPIREGGRWYVLARTFGALISRERPASVRPASFGCRR